jgi:hypothetical protein
MICGITGAPLTSSLDQTAFGLLPVAMMAQHCTLAALPIF